MFPTQVTTVLHHKNKRPSLTISPPFFFFSYFSVPTQLLKRLPLVIIFNIRVDVVITQCFTNEIHPLYSICSLQTLTKYLIVFPAIKSFTRTRTLNKMLAFQPQQPVPPFTPKSSTTVNFYP